MRKETVVGESSVLQCLSELAADLSQPHREWFKDNKPFHLGTLSADTERYFFTSEHELLVIVNTESADAGNYRCEISDNSKTYTVQTELIVVKEELSQNMIFVGVVIVAALCVLIIALVIFALCLHQRRKTFKRRQREDCQIGNSTSGAPSGLLSGSAGLIASGARIASTSTQLLSSSRGSALDQTQLTILNRTLLHKSKMDAQRQRPNSLGDFDALAVNHADNVEHDNQRQLHQNLIITHTPNYQQLLQQHASDDVDNDAEHFTLSYLKRISLADNAGVAADHNQDHLSSKDSGTGSDTAVKRSIDDFTMTGEIGLAPTTTTSLQRSTDCATTPVLGGKPQLVLRGDVYREDGLGDSYSADDGGDMDDADLLYAATHALGVSECDVELLDFNRHRTATMRIDDKDAHTERETDPDADTDAANEHTYFLNKTNCANNDNSRDHTNANGKRQQSYECLPTTAKMHFPPNNSGNSFDGGGNVTGASNNPNAFNGNCKTNLCSAPGSHAQSIDI